jgi:putative transposase
VNLCTFSNQFRYFKEMIINRSYKVELSINNKQRSLLEKSAGVARFTYNWGLNERIEIYKAEKKSLTAIDQYKILCSKKKTEFPWMYDVSKCAPQEALRNLDKSFKNFFRGVKQGKKIGFPKFKSKHKSKQAFSISFGFYITNSTINIPKVGYVKLKEKGYIPTKDVKYNSLTISKTADRWFASVQVEQDIPEPINSVESVLGVDVGIKTLATCSNGQTFENPKYLKKLKKKLAHAQKNLARKKFDRETKRSSNNRLKSKLRVQKIHHRISNQRKDTLHKMTSILARTKPRYIVLEDLNVSGMMKNHKLAGAIGDVSFNEIKRQLSYKTAWYGGSIIEVDRFFPSSKMCSKCGQIKEDLTLEDRVYVCDCGNVIDRDLNASINLERYGLIKLENTGSSPGIEACGESVRPVQVCLIGEAVSMNQEENIRC